MGRGAHRGTLVGRGPRRQGRPRRVTVDNHEGLLESDASHALAVDASFSLASSLSHFVLSMFTKRGEEDEDEEDEDDGHHHDGEGHEYADDGEGDEEEGYYREGEEDGEAALYGEFEHEHEHDQGSAALDEESLAGGSGSDAGRQSRANSGPTGILDGLSAAELGGGDGTGRVGRNSVSSTGGGGAALATIREADGEGGAEGEAEADGESVAPTPGLASARSAAAANAAAVTTPQLSEPAALASVSPASSGQPSSASGATSSFATPPHGARPPSGAAAFSSTCSSSGRAVDGSSIQVSIGSDSKEHDSRADAAAAAAEGKEGKEEDTERSGNRRSSAGGADADGEGEDEEVHQVLGAEEDGSVASVGARLAAEGLRVQSTHVSRSTPR